MNRITQIYSASNPSVLLATLYSPQNINNRVDLTKPNGILQAAVMVFHEGAQVSPHKHNLVERQTTGTSESWVVMEGSIKFELFDLDDKPLESWILNRGSIVITEQGGHSLTSLKPNTLIYEFKNGPYWGADVDKIQIKH